MFQEVRNRSFVEVVGVFSTRFLFLPFFEDAASRVSGLKKGRSVLVLFTASEVEIMRIFRDLKATCATCSLISILFLRL